jgi:NADPH:quinone reductase
LALSLEQAAAIGIAYLAASLGVIEYTQLAAGETLLVAGAGGGVGTAAAHIGKWRGARVIGVDRHELPSESPAAAALDDFFSLEGKALDEVIRRATGGRGAQVIVDSVGGPMFKPASKSLGRPSRQVEITSVGDRRVSFDFVDFYHNERATSSAFSR